MTKLNQVEPKSLRITQSVYSAILKSVGKLPPESGGILGGREDDDFVTHFHFDSNAQCSTASYTPDLKTLGNLFRDWNSEGVRFMGVVHSHPFGYRHLSIGDLSYAREIIEANPNLRRLLLPLVVFDKDNSFEFIPYEAVLDGRRVRVQRLQLQIVDESPASAITPPEENTPPYVTFVQSGSDAQLDETFSRVRSAYDLGRLSASRLITVGVGGSTSFVEDKARAGVGEFVLIDHDDVALSNLATQHYYRHDVGRPKVECLAERLRNINPGAVVVTVPKKLNELSDNDVARLAFEPFRRWNVEGHYFWGILGAAVPVEVTIPPVVTLLCGTTDDFDAQARINRLAIQFGMPSLCAQMYERGRAAEITFTYPGVTPACHRCILQSRYEAYERGFRNRVTSAGSPIFATTRVNSLMGSIATALLQVASEHEQWAHRLQRIGDRNLVQIRLDPDAPTGIFENILAGAARDAIFCDETVWLKQMPKADCPDCGGCGDLRLARGRFQDTRDKGPTNHKGPE